MIPDVIWIDLIYKFEKNQAVLKKEIINQPNIYYIYLLFYVYHQIIHFHDILLYTHSFYYNFGNNN